MYRFISSEDVMKDLFIYRIVENSWYNRHFRQRHEVRFERNIQKVLHEFAQMKEKIYYFEQIVNVKYHFWENKSTAIFWRNCMFGDKAWNIICQKILKENDFKQIFDFK